MRRRIFLPLWITCIILCLAGTGIPVKAQTEQFQVTDNADLLNDVEELRLSEQIEELELSTNWDVMLLTVDDVTGMTSEYIAEEWFDTYTTNDNGAICLIDMESRELVIRTFGDAIPYITDSRVEDILDAAFYAAGDEDYYGAFNEMLLGISDAYQRGIPDNTQIYDEDTGEVISHYTKEKKLTVMEVVMAVAVSLLAGGITIGVIIGKYRLKWGGYQYSYRENGNVVLSVKRDTFVNQIVTHRRIQQNTSGGNGGKSRSTTHIGAGGRRSGGGSRKF